MATPQGFGSPAPGGPTDPAVNVRNPLAKALSRGDITRSQLERISPVPPRPDAPSYAEPPPVDALGNNPARSTNGGGSDDCGDDLRMGKTASIRSVVTRTLKKFVSDSPARRTREWCSYEGAWGVLVVFVLCLTIMNLLIIFALHSTSLFDKLQGRPGVRKILLITPTVACVVGIICIVLFLRIVWAVVFITCRHSHLHAKVGRQLQSLQDSQWRVFRAWQVFDNHTSPGGRFFDWWEFSREVVESSLQILAIREYADNGVDRTFLDLYVFVMFANSFSAIALMVPRCCSGKSGGKYTTLAARGRRERLLLLLDAVCDTIYSLFPTLYLALVLVTQLFGERGRVFCAEMRLKNQACKDAQGIVIMPMLVELLLGGSTLAKIMLKMATRMTPLWFVASRAVESVQAMAVARETAKRAQRKSTTGAGIVMVENLMSHTDSPPKPRRKRIGTVFTRQLEKERTERASRPPLHVPLWMTSTYTLLVWGFCVFAWIRFGQLSAPCAATGTPWAKGCRSRSLPLFDFTLPGTEAACACNTLITAPELAGDAGSTANIVPSSYHCGENAFMEDVYRGLFSQTEQAKKAAPYVQTVFFFTGCAVNNSHVQEMFVRLTNLRAFFLVNSKAIVPPLRIPTATMDPSSQLMVLYLRGGGVEEIPPQIGRLSATLTVLLLQGNPALRELPRELSDCTNLGILFLKHNAISTVPAQLGRLTGLGSFALTGNGVSSLPEELGSMTNLQNLQLANNALRTLPASFARMTILKRLNLAGNNMTVIPVLDSAPQTWTALKHLDIEANNISKLPQGWVAQATTSAAEVELLENVQQLEEASGDGLYDIFVEKKGQASEVQLLVLVSRNPMTEITNGSLQEMKRDGKSEQLPLMLVSSRPECAPGCISTPWKAAKEYDLIGDLRCHEECNVTSCEFDRGDCPTGWGTNSSSN